MAAPITVEIQEKMVKLSSSSVEEEEPIKEKMVRLRSSDNQCFEVPESAAVLFQAPKHMVEDLGGGDGDCIDTIPVSNIDSKTLAKVLEYCKKHADETVEEGDLKIFDKEFVQLRQDELCDLLLAANYLDIKGLLDILCQQAADMMKGKAPEEIRKTFNIVNDFTPEEEEEVRRENAWAFE